MVALEHSGHAVEVVRVGNILEIAEPIDGVLNIDVGLVSGGTKLVADVGDEVIGFDDLFFLESPFIRLHIVV